MKLFEYLGNYAIFIKKVFAEPEKKSIYKELIIKEIDKLGMDSLGIVAIISLFLGAVVTLQTAYGMENPLLPRYLIGLAARDSMILEFSSTIVCLILAGKVGSNIASEIGTMRITEQIDALEIMGVNPASYLVLPKIIGLILIIPFMVVISMFLGILGGWIFGTASGVITTSDYVMGIQYSFTPYYVFYTEIKAVIFSFLITSISGFHGYYAYGGALEVGKASTDAVVRSSIAILLFNTILTNLLLT
jgi:phospholipid/cholesterol/gamma-HCH transport system permease protein